MDTKWTKILQIDGDGVFLAILDNFFERSYLLGQYETADDSPIHREMDIQRSEKFVCPAILHSFIIWPKLTNPLTDANLLLDGCDII
ncbi:MAG: hypothetical protein ACLQO6_14200 [Desulfomonilaceae bacterium]